MPGSPQPDFFFFGHLMVFFSWGGNCTFLVSNPPSNIALLCVFHRAISSCNSVLAQTAQWSYGYRSRKPAECSAIDAMKFSGKQLKLHIGLSIATPWGLSCRVSGVPQRKAWHAFSLSQVQANTVEFSLPVSDELLRLLVGSGRRKSLLGSLSHGWWKCANNDGVHC